jgi:hypothetical protein
MFAFELSTARPCGSAPYYSLVIRDPYIIGNSPSADIAIAYDGISEQHVSLAVLHARDAEKEIAAALKAAGATAATSAGGVATTPQDEEDSADAPRYDEEKEVEAAAVPKPAGAAADTAAEDHDHADALPDSHPSKPAGGDDDGAEEVAVRAPSASNDHLVVRVTALPSKGEAEVRIGNVILRPGDSVIVRDGDVLFLGDGVSGVFRYRPLLVGLEVGTYPEDYVSDLRRMFDQLGATFVDEPMPSSEVSHVPIGQLYCAEELNDSTSCLAALAYGYSIVQPTYVFEWFAAVSKKASAPLSTLPSPARFEVPVRCTTHPTTTMYLRPESDTCPFSLFPIPSTAMTNRSRADLFAGRVFFFFTDAAATRYWRAVEDCNGAVYGPGDVESAKEAIHRLVEAQRKIGTASSRLPNNFYIIIDNTSEAVLLNSGLEAASPELLAFMNEAANSCGATNLCVMGDHSLFTALLSNKFCEEPVPLTAGVPVAAASSSYNDPAGGSSAPPLSAADVRVAEGNSMNINAVNGGGAAAAPVNARTPRSTYSSRCHNAANGGVTHNSGTSGPATARSASRMSTRESDRRNSLLPRTAERTPSRSQLRSYSRLRARSASMQSEHSDGVPAACDGASYYGSGSTSGRHGRRHLVPSVIEGEMRSFAEDFDIVRVRIYAFLVREEPKLDKAIATYHRSLYVNIDAMEYALEIKAQAQDFMEHVDDLLADPACHGAYTESLRRFWRDCSDMDVKAQHLLHCWDRRFPAAALPRRSQSSRRAGSRRTPSTRSVTPRGAAHSASNSLAPAVGSQPRDGNVPHKADYLAPTTNTAATHPRGMESGREHRDLYTSPEAASRLQEAEDQGAMQAEHPFTQQHDGFRAHDSGSGASPSSSRARGYSGSSRQSRRRSLTPRSRASRANSALHTVPIDQRPPWVDKWAEEAQQEQEQQEAKQHQATEKPAYELYRASLHSTPTRSAKDGKKPPTVRTTPAGDVAKYAPAVVRLRSRGRSASKPRRTPAPSNPPKPAAPHHHEAILSDGSVKFSVEGDDVTSPLEFVEEHPLSQTHHDHTEGDEDTHDATYGTVDFAEEEPPTHAAELPHTDGTEDEGEEQESQVRTAPAPTPQPAPATSRTTRKAATPTFRQPRAKSTSASAKANGQGSRRKSKAEAPSQKTQNVLPWRY